MREAESLARWVYTQTFSSEYAPPGPAVLLRRLIGSNRIKVLPVSRATIQRDRAGFKALIPCGLDPSRLCMALGSALAGIAAAAGTTEIKLDDDGERKTAAAIVMPRPALRAAVESLGVRVDQLSAAFVVPESVALERLRALGINLASGTYRLGTAEKNVV